MDAILSYKSLEKVVKYLRTSGFYRLDRRSPRKYIILHTIYMRFLLLFFLLYTVQQILKINEVQDNVDQMMGTMFLLLTNTDCIYKGLVLWIKEDQIEEVLNVMKGPVFNQGKPEHKGLLQETISKALRLVRVYNSTALFTCFLWALHPTILHIQGKQIDFPVWLPCDPNSNPQYYFVVIYIWLQTSWLAYCNTTTDVFIAFLLEQCRTQVSILRLDLESVVEKSKEETITSSLSYAQIINRRFNKMLIHHNEILNTADKIQDIFGGAVFYQFLVSGWILCTATYRMINMNPFSVEFVSMIMYVMCILVELYLYCYYGNEITSESEKLTDSAYAMDWLELPMSELKSLIIFMERTKRPIQPMAGLTVPLCKSTFVSIVKSSYSFYAFLKNSEH